MRGNEVLTRIALVGAMVLGASALGTGRPARATQQGSGGATVITYGPEGGGIEVTAAAYADDDGYVGSGSSGSDESSDVSEPQPVAISLHNCIPIYGSSGIPLDYSFSEAASGDCASFARPEPVTSDPGDPVPALDPLDLAYSAFDQALALAPAPRIETAPSKTGLTGLRTFFWTDEPEPLVVTAGVAGLFVTAEAAPTRYEWSFGDGGRRVTAGPGRPWTRARPGDIRHVYQRRGRFEVRVTIVWAARWRLGDGPWQPLGYFSTQGSRELPVRQVISVLTRTR